MLRFLLLAALATIALGGVPPKLRSPRPQLDGRIVGGVPVTISDYAHQLSLEWYGFHICGASIVSDTVAITAAHCTDGSSASELSVRAGTSFVESGGQLIQVAEIRQHPDFDYFNIDYDITVLILSKPIELGSTAQPIPLPEENQVFPSGIESVVSGWGALREGGSSPDQLQAVLVPIVNIAECKEAYGESSITERMICAGFPKGGSDACQGDSGGPLVVPGDEKDDLLVGVVSWGYGCARPSYPGVYASVPNLRGFIKEAAGL